MPDLTYISQREERMEIHPQEKANNCLTAFLAFASVDPYSSPMNRLPFEGRAAARPRVTDDVSEFRADYLPL